MNGTVQYLYYIVLIVILITIIELDSRVGLSMRRPEVEFARVTLAC